MSFYAPIYEKNACFADSATSDFDNQEGWKAQEYRQLVDFAARVAEREKKRQPAYSEAIDLLFERYVHMLARWMNNEKTDVHAAKRLKIDKLLQRMRSIGDMGIEAKNAAMLVKLEGERDDLVEEQEYMRAVNAYWCQHKSLEGCEWLTAEQAMQLLADMEKRKRAGFAPFTTRNLANNKAAIRRIEGCIKELTDITTTGNRRYGANVVNGLEVIENPGIMRIQLVFAEAPNKSVIAILKNWGFRWSPLHGAWQRLLNDKGRYAAEMAIERIADQMKQLGSVNGALCAKKELN